MSTRKKFFLIGGLVFLVLLLLLCCCVFFYWIFNISLTSITDTQLLEQGDSSQVVAVIDVKDIITSTPTTDFWGTKTPDMVTRITEKIKRAAEDDNVKAVILRIDSPGGEVYATKQIYNEILELKNKGKKIVSLLQSMAASGAYYLAAPADKIIASDSTITGSIGVVFSSLDITGLYEKIGIKEITVVNSEGKLKVLSDLMNEDSEGYKLLQGVADDIYDSFVDVVAKGRKKTVDQVKKLADGRIYSGKDAEANGLVDSLGEEKEARSIAAELVDLDNPTYILYEDNQDLGSIYGFSLLQLLKPELSVLKQVKPGVYAYYLLSAQY